MKKKINVIDNNLGELLNEYAKHDKADEKNKNILKEKTDVIIAKKKYLNIVSLVCNGILLVLIVILLVSLENKKSQIEEINYEFDDSLWNYKIDSENLDDLLDGDTYYYVKNKLDFIDENIVFVIEGYGNYYYTYDCMMTKVEGEYTYWAYNKEQAISRGYKKGSCY